MKKTGIYNRILLTLLAALLLVGGVGVTLFPAPTFSEQENRMLADFPTASPEGLASGGYTAAIDTYLSERFPWRGQLRNLYATTDLALGKMESSGVMLREGDTLLATPAPSTAISRKNQAALTRLAREINARPLPLHVAVIPHRTVALRALLPAFYGELSQAELERLTAALPDAHVLMHLRERGDWYRTDHHLTTRGAYRVYVALADTLGFTPHKESDFEITTTSDRFLGTLDARAGIPHITPDRIQLWRFAGDTEYLVRRDGKTAAFDAFYDREKLQTRDGYAVFFGGNCGVLEVTLFERDTRPTLLVVKDSYANAVIPFLARHFRILAIDPRYASEEVLREGLMAADVALFLFGAQTLTETPFLK